MKHSYLVKILLSILLVTVVTLLSSTPALSRSFDEDYYNVDTIDEDGFIVDREQPRGQGVDYVEFIDDEDGDGLNEILLVYEDGTEEVSYSSDSEEPAESETDEEFDTCQVPDNNFPTIFVTQGIEFDPTQEDKAESINAAIDKLNEYGFRGRIVISSGVYEENIQPQDAHIILEAKNKSESGLYEHGYEELDQPKLIALDGSQPAISIAPETTFCLNGISVRGDWAAIVAGTDEPGGAVHEIKLNNVYIMDSKYGVFGYVNKFQIVNSLVEYNTHGLMIEGSSSIINSRVSHNSIGIVAAGKITKAPPVGSTIRAYCADSANKMYKNLNQVVIQNVIVTYNQKGGIAVCQVGNATITKSALMGNQYVGIQIYHTTKFTLSDNGVHKTFKLNKEYGDSLVVVASIGDVVGNTFFSADRAGLLYYDVKGGTIRKNNIMFAVFAINIENSVPKIYKDNYMFGNVYNEVTSSKLKIAPPPSVPKP